MTDLTNSSGRQQILLTGGTGFLGRAVAERLRGEGKYNVVAPGRKEYDLTSADAISGMLRSLKPAIIVHLAAVVGGIGANSEQPGRFFYENALMGIHLMELARRHGVRKFVAVGTVCSYPKECPVPFREADIWEGYPEETNAPYGLAKKMLLVQAQAYRKQYDFNAIYLMPTNLYGPGDNFDPASSHVIPSLIRKCVEANEKHLPEIIVWGDGTPTREFLFVRDAAEGIVLAMERYDKPDPVNLGGGSELSVGDLAKLIARLTGFGGRIAYDPSRPNGQPRRAVDSSRAEKEFGFRSKTPLEEGLKLTIAEYLRTHTEGRETLSRAERTTPS